MMTTILILPTVLYFYVIGCRLALHHAGLLSGRGVNYLRHTREARDGECIHLSLKIFAWIQFFVKMKSFLVDFHFIYVVLFNVLLNHEIYPFTFVWTMQLIGWIVRPFYVVWTFYCFCNVVIVSLNSTHSFDTVEIIDETIKQSRQWNTKGLLLN